MDLISYFDFNLFEFSLHRDYSRSASRLHDYKFSILFVFFSHNVTSNGWKEPSAFKLFRPALPPRTRKRRIIIPLLQVITIKRAIYDSAVEGMQ